MDSNASAHDPECIWAESFVALTGGAERASVGVVETVSLRRPTDLSTSLTRGDFASSLNKCKGAVDAVLHPRVEAITAVAWHLKVHVSVREVHAGDDGLGSLGLERGQVVDERRECAAAAAGFEDSSVARHNGDWRRLRRHEGVHVADCLHA